MVSTPNILFDWIYVLNNCFLRQTQNEKRIRRNESINTSINQSANYYYINRDLILLFRVSKILIYVNTNSQIIHCKKLMIPKSERQTPAGSNSG